MVLGYEDLFAANGRFRPGATDVRDELFIENGKLVLRSTSLTFDVDSESLRRLPTNETPQTDIYKQLR
jgi:hypothetical protein